MESYFRNLIQNEVSFIKDMDAPVKFILYIYKNVFIYLQIA